MHAFCTTVFCLLTPSLMLGTGSTDPNDKITSALNLLYDAKFEESRYTLSAYSSSHPEDPLAYSFQAATYLFSALDQSGVMKKGFFNEDRNVSEGRPTSISATDLANFNAAIAKARDASKILLTKTPADRNALLAMCIVAGVQRDYLALVEHRLRESYDYIKESQTYSSRLLKVDPTAYDAYLTKGFTEYLIASLPFYLRWFMKIDDISVTKERGLQDLRLAADSGQYMKPFAQLLLAMFYLREKQEDRSEKLLTRLAAEFPHNPTYRSELEQLESSHRPGTN